MKLTLLLWAPLSSNPESIPAKNTLRNIPRVATSVICLLELNTSGSIASNLLLSNEMLLGSSDNPVVIKSLW